MLLGTDTQVWSPEWWPVSLGDCPSPVSSVKNLGMLLDTKLSFNAQINKLTSTIWLILKMIRKILPYIPLDSRKTVITALVLSRLDFGNTLYAGIQAQHLAKLQRLQNAAARLILDIPRYDHVSHRLKMLHWLPIGKRIKFKALCLTYKALQGKGPHFLQSHLKPYEPARILRSSQAKLIQVPRFKRTSWGGRSFLLHAANTWNLLTMTIKNSPSLTSFRKEIKTWLFASR